MFIKNSGIEQKNAPFFEDSNLLSGQGAGLAIKSTFKDVFDGLLESKGMDGGNQSRSGSDTGVKYMSYNELKIGLSEAGKNDACDAVEMQKVESAIKWLANYLGIKPSFLLAVFEKLNIDPRDMADESKLMEIINKLAEHFKLSEEQKKEIAEKLGGIFRGTL